MPVSPATKGATRGARVLVKRLARDCGIAWPGGPDNAELHHVGHGKKHGESRVFELRPLDGVTAYPRIFSCYPATYLLRHGFRVQADGAEQELLPAGMDAPI